MCTKTIVHTMLKDPDIARYSTRRTHRTYTAEFKAELVAACLLTPALNCHRLPTMSDPVRCLHTCCWCGKHFVKVGQRFVCNLGQKCVGVNSIWLNLMYEREIALSHKWGMAENC